ncbi:MAG: phosphodiester glycosidase family protein [Clostridia bacterium]|nr:phosphodiester glycosidase family protein [Clostridia bacterium]
MQVSLQIRERRPAVAGRKLAAFTTAMLLVFAALACAQTGGDVGDVLISKSTIIPLGPGVTLERRNSLTAAGWLQMSIIMADLSSPYVTVAPFLAGNVLTSPARVTSIASSWGLAAAVNGDFFDMGATGAPLSFAAAGGDMIRSPRVDPDFASIAVLSSGTGILGEWRWQGSLVRIDAQGSTASDPNLEAPADCTADSSTGTVALATPSNASMALSGMNEVSVPANGAILYDHRWAQNQRPVRNDISYIRIRHGVIESRGTGWPPPDTPPPPKAAPDPVIAPESYPPVPQPEQETFTRAPAQEWEPAVDIVMRGAANDASKPFSIGDSVMIEGRFLPDLPDLSSAFSGKPVLVRSGLVQPNLDRHTGIQGGQPAPRTAAGLSCDGRVLILVAVDGRVQGSRGVTLPELARIMVSLGAQDALNLDGGGSTAAAVRNPTQNTVSLASRPSGGAERPVPYAVGVQTAEGVAVNAVDSRGSIAVFVWVSVYDTQSYASSGRPLGTFPSLAAAVNGGASAFVAPEVTIPVGGQALLAAELLDSSARVVSPDSLGTVPVEWSVTPPKGTPQGAEAASLLSVSSDTLTAILAPPREGRYEVKATGAGLNRVLFAVRAQRRDDAPTLPLSSNGTGSAGSVKRILMETFETGNGWWGAGSPSAMASRAWTSTPPDTTYAALPPSAPSSSYTAVPVGKPFGQAAALAYDFTSPEGTRAAYLRPPAQVRLPAGSVALGLWVYGDSGEHWLRATLADSTGQRMPIDFPRISWNGWRYVEATIPAALAQPVTLEQVYLVEFRPELVGAGVIYIDDIQLMVASAGPWPVGADLAATIEAAAALTLTAAPTEVGAPLSAKSSGGHRAIEVDVSRSPLPWRELIAELESFRSSDDVQLTVVLQGGFAVDPATRTPGGSFKDPLEAELLLRSLSACADGSTQVTLVQTAPIASGDSWISVDGVTVVFLARPNATGNGPRAAAQPSPSQQVQPLVTSWRTEAPCGPSSARTSCALSS